MKRPQRDWWSSICHMQENNLDLRCFLTHHGFQLYILLIHKLMTLEGKFQANFAYMQAGMSSLLIHAFTQTFVTLTNSPKNGHGLIYLSALLCTFSTPV